MASQVLHGFPVIINSPDTLSETELSLLDGAVEGTIVASKAISANSSGYVPHRRHVIEDAITVALTAAQTGALIVLDKVDGVTVTLPAPAIGLWFDFVVDVASTSVGQKIITDAASTFLKGALPHLKSDNTFTFNVANGTTHVSLTMDGTTKGGIAGSRFRLTCRSATVWEIEGMLLASGTVATPFATS